MLSTKEEGQLVEHVEIMAQLECGKTHGQMRPSLPRWQTEYPETTEQ